MQRKQNCHCLLCSFLQLNLVVILSLLTNFTWFLRNTACVPLNSHSEEAEIGVGLRRVLKPPASSSPLPHRENPAHMILGWSLGLSEWVAKQGDNILLTFLLFLKNILSIYLLVFKNSSLAASGLHYDMQDLFVAVRGLFVAVHGLLSSSGMQAPEWVGSVAVAGGLQSPWAL